MDKTSYYIKNLLRDVSLTLHEHFPDVDYFLAYGSLLGYTRDGNVIPWDSDADIYFPKNRAEELKEVMLNSDKCAGGKAFGTRAWKPSNAYYGVFRRLGEKDCKHFVKRPHRPCRPTLDFYLYEEDGDDIELRPPSWFSPAKWKTTNQPLRRTGEKWWKNARWRRFSKDLVFPLKNEIMLDFPVKVPNDSHRYLSRVYGKDYMTPNRTWKKTN